MCLGTLGSLAAQAQFANANYGPSSLVSNTTGYDNSAFGQNSLYHKTTGYENAALGAYSLWLNPTGVRKPPNLKGQK